MTLAIILESTDPTERDLAELFLLLAVGLCALSAVAFGTGEEQNYTAKKTTLRFSARFWYWLAAAVIVAGLGQQVISRAYPVFEPMYLSRRGSDVTSQAISRYFLTSRTNSFAFATILSSSPGAHALGRP